MSPEFGEALFDDWREDSGFAKRRVRGSGAEGRFRLLIFLVHILGKYGFRFCFIHKSMIPSHNTTTLFRIALDCSHFFLKRFEMTNNPPQERDSVDFWSELVVFHQQYSRSE